MTSAIKTFGRELLQKVKTPTPPEPTPGLHHYQHQSGQEQTRVHLRLEDDGHGLLVVNANRIFHLNPTAAYMAYLLLEGTPPDQVVLFLTRRYHVKSNQAWEDFRIISSQLNELIKPDGACPVYDLGLETIAPFSAHPSAPYRMDLAITYRCNNDCAHCYNIRPRQSLELTTETWKKIIDRIWEIGIPHIVFTGGEPTLRPDLVELIAHAERTGQITGINTNGRRLKNTELLNKLVEAGLDHVQITLESHDPQVHDRIVNHPGAWQETVSGIRNAVASRLFVMTNTTLLKENSADLAKTLDFLSDLDVQTVGLNALIYSGRGKTVGTGLPESELPELLELARKKLELAHQRLIWYTPTQYCHFDPMLLELGVKGCTAALYNMCIEPDGKVIPCQSYYQPLGDLLTDEWQKIWNHELAINLRERREIPPACSACSFKQECGGGCPLYRQAVPDSTAIMVKPLEKVIQM